jgi:hypothetical protein
MFKYYITKEEFNMLKNNSKFLTAIRLLRMENTIITALSLFERADTNSSETTRNKRDKTEAILYFGAVLYESLKTLHKMRKDLDGLEQYKLHTKDINCLFGELSNPNSFTNTILVEIRDRLVFHFDKKVFQESLSGLDISEKEFTIVEGDSEMSGDINNSVIPVLYSNYLIKKATYHGSDEEKLKYIYDEMNSISVKLREVIGNIAGELLKDTVHYKEN